jgi:biopolymer transport protein ExbD
VALLAVVACTRPERAAPSAPGSEPTVVVPLLQATGAAPDEHDTSDEPPRASARPTASALPAGEPTLEIVVDAGGPIRVAGVAVASDDELVSRVRDALARSGRHDGVIRAHPSVAYAEVVRVMDRAREGGLTDVTFAVLR